MFCFFGGGRGWCTGGCGGDNESAIYGKKIAMEIKVSTRHASVVSVLVGSAYKSVCRRRRCIMGYHSGYESWLIGGLAWALWVILRCCGWRIVAWDVSSVPVAAAKRRLSVFRIAYRRQKGSR